MSNLELKGALSMKKQKKMELAIRADGLIKGIKHLLATSSITPISEIDIEQAASLMSDLLRIKKEYLEILEEIRKIEQELE